MIASLIASLIAFLIAIPGGPRRRRLANAEELDFLDAETGLPQNRLFAKLARQQHWRRCGTCGDSVEAPDEAGFGHCFTCGSALRWSSTAPILPCNTLRELLQEFRWQAQETNRNVSIANSTFPQGASRLERKRLDPASERTVRFALSPAPASLPRDQTRHSKGEGRLDIPRWHVRHRAPSVGPACCSV